MLHEEISVTVVVRFTVVRHRRTRTQNRKHIGKCETKRAAPCVGEAVANHTRRMRAIDTMLRNMNHDDDGCSPLYRNETPIGNGNTV